MVTLLKNLIKLNLIWMSFNKRQLRILINSLTRELKDCEDDSRYEKLWEERRLLKEELETKIKS